jgi:hypothetical protein
VTPLTWGSFRWGAARFGDAADERPRPTATQSDRPLILLVVLLGIAGVALIIATML